MGFYDYISKEEYQKEDGSKSKYQLLAEGDCSFTIKNFYFKYPPNKVPYVEYILDATDEFGVRADVSYKTFKKETCIWQAKIFLKSLGFEGNPNDFEIEKCIGLQGTFKNKHTEFDWHTTDENGTAVVKRLTKNEVHFFYKNEAGHKITGYVDSMNNDEECKESKEFFNDPIPF